MPRLFNAAAKYQFEADTWEQAITILQALVVREARGVYGLEKWEPKAGAELLPEEETILHLELGVFPALLKLAAGLPLNDDNASYLTEAVEAIRDTIASCHWGQARRVSIQTVRADTLRDLYYELRKERRVIDRHESERDRFRAVMHDCPGRGTGRVDWTKAGKTLGMSDNGARKKARALGLIK